MQYLQLKDGCVQEIKIRSCWISSRSVSHGLIAANEVLIVALLHRRHVKPKETT